MYTVEKIEYPESPEFPKLMRSKITQTLVLFRVPGEGIVLEAGKDVIAKAGYISKDFAMHHFEDFNGSITISNER